MKKLIGIFSVLFIIIFITVPTTFAAYKISSNENVVSLPKGEVVDGNYYAAGESVEIFGTVNGDVYAFGGQVLIDGEITGDLITAGGMVNVSGTVGQDLRAAGGQIVINSNVGKNLSVAGGNIDIGNIAKVGGAAQIAGGNVTVSAPINSELLLGAGNVTVNNQVGGDLNAGVGTMRLSGSANVSGNLNYWSEEEASIDNSATVSGQVMRHDPKFNTNTNQPTQEQVKQFFTGVSLFSKLGTIIVSLIFGFAMLKLFPNYTQRASELVQTNTLRSLGYGFLAVIAFPFIVLLLLITILGIPFGLFLIPVFIFYIYIVRIFVMLAMGKFLSQKANLKNSSELLTFLIGLIAYYVLTILPILGGLIKFILILIGLGAALVNDKKTYQASRKSKIL